jgi:adenylosuccinate lyase
MSRDAYSSPFAERYSTPEMLRLFSADTKFRTWRKLWIALAESQRELGLDISPAQIAELKAHAEDIDYTAVARHEARLRHDVMAHIHAWGDVCPKAKPIIHWGATSMYVVDNADLIVLRGALDLVRRELVNVAADLAAFARKWANEPTVAYTHLQPGSRTSCSTSKSWNSAARASGSWGSRGRRARRPISCRSSTATRRRSGSSTSSWRKKWDSSGRGA